MKKTFFASCALALFLSSCAVGTGLIYTDTKTPLTATSNHLGSKVGQASVINVLGLVALGDASIQEAAKSAGISRVSHVDVKSEGLLGIFVKKTVFVYGD